MQAISTDTAYILTSGFLIKTTDQGNYWINLGKIDDGLSDLWFINNDVGYAAGINGKIFKTVDGGANWNLQTSGLGSNLYSLFFLNEDTGFAVGEFGTFLKTLDGGVTWALMPTGITATWLAGIYFFNADTGYIVGSNNILKTIDGGNSWIDQNGGVSGPGSGTYYLFDVCFLNLDTGFACGTGAEVYKTVDGGTNWICDQTGVGGTCTDLHFFNDSVGVMVTTYEVFKTYDGGVSWSSVLNTPASSGSMHFFDDSVGYVVGGNESIRVTLDGGNTWYSPSIAYSSDLNAVVMVDALTGYAGGDNGTLLTTSDGGETWTPLYSGISNHIRDIEFTNDSVGYACADGGKLIRTVDAGMSWDTIPTGLNTNLLSIQFQGPDTGYVTGEVSMLKTIDGGSTWSVPNTINNTVNSICFVDAEIGYATAAVWPWFYKTTDGALSWNPVYLPLPYDKPTTTYFINDSVGFVGFDDRARILVTRNAGKDWRYAHYSTALIFNSRVNKFSFSDPDTGYAVLGIGVILKTDDGGRSWFRQFCDDLDVEELNDVHVNGSTGFIVGEDRIIMKTVNGGIRANVPPEITSFDSNSPFDRTAQISYELVDVENDECSILVEYSTDFGSTWAPATEALSTNGTASLLSHYTGKQQNYYWNTLADSIALSGSETVKIRITPSDADLGTYKDRNYQINNAETAQKDWDELDSEFAADLKSIHFEPGGVGYCIGNTGGDSQEAIIMKSADFGDSWQEVAAMAVIVLNSVFAISPDSAIAVGDDGAGYRTIDGGNNWVALDMPGVTYDLRSVLFTSNKIGYIRAEGFGVYKTVDGGDTWTLTLSMPGNAAMSFISDSIGMVCGNTVYATVDGGDTWVQKNFGLFNSYYTLIALASDQIAYVGVGSGSGSNFYVTDDFGNTWNPTGANVNAIKLQFTDTDLGFALGAAFERTENGGEDWSLHYLGTIYIPADMYMVNDTMGIIVGERGMMVKTINGGGNELPVISNIQVSDISGSILVSYMLNDPDGDYCDLVVEYSPDNGVTWNTATPHSWSDPVTNVSMGMHTFAWNSVADLVGMDCFNDNVRIRITPYDSQKGISDQTSAFLIDNSYRNQWEVLSSGTINDLSDLHFTSAEVGFAVGSFGKLVKTTDGGDTWTTVNSNSTSGLTSIHFSDANTGYILEGLGQIIKTTDGGDTWVDLYDLSSPVREIRFVTPNIGYVFGGLADVSAFVYKTTDGGTTWTSQTPNTSYSLYASFFITENIGYAVGNLGVIIKTTDGGATWVNQNSGTSESLQSVYFLSADTGIAVAHNGLVIRTMDGGANWVELSGSNSHLRSIFYAGSRAYAVGKNGVVLSTDNFAYCWATEVSGVTGDLQEVYFPADSLGFAVGDDGVILRTTFSVPAALGCTDSNYVEYNPLATIDDGSCETLVNWLCPYITAVFTQSADTVNLTVSGYVEFFNATDNTDSWTWDFGNGTNANFAYSANVTYDSVGVYTVTLIVENIDLCTDTFSSAVVVIDAISVDDRREGSLRIYPNPNSGSFTITIPPHLVSGTSLQLYHVDGRLVHNIEIQKSNAEIHEVIDLSKLSKGIYYIRIPTETGVLVEKVVYH